MSKYTLWVILGPFAASTDWAQKKATIDTTTKVTESRPNMAVEKQERFYVTKRWKEGRGEIDLSGRVSSSPDLIAVGFGPGTIGGKP